MSGRKKLTIPKHQDTQAFTTSLSIVAESVEATDLCLSITIADKDLADDDPIGAATTALESGDNAVEVGQATVSVEVQAAEGDKIDETPVNLPPPPIVRPALYKVSLVTARIHATKTDGVTWDEPKDKDDEDAKQIKALIGIGLKVYGGGAILGALLGGGDDGPSHKAQTAAAPDPRVVIRWGGLTLATLRNRNTV